MEHARAARSVSIASSNTPSLHYVDDTKYKPPKYGKVVTRHRIDIRENLGMSYSIAIDKQNCAYVTGSVGATWRAGIRRDAKLIEVDGIPIKNQDTVREVVADRKQRGLPYIDVLCVQPLHAVSGVDYFETPAEGDRGSPPYEGASDDGAYDGEPSYTPEQEAEVDEFVDRIMECFDADRDGVLSYEEHSATFTAVGTKYPYSRELFDLERPGGYTRREYKDKLLEDYHTSTAAFMQVMTSKMDAGLIRPINPPAPRRSQQHGRHHKQPPPLPPPVHRHSPGWPQYTASPPHHGAPSPSTQRAGDDYALPPGPYPTAWGIGPGEGGRAAAAEGGSGARVVSVDLRTADNHALKRALLQCTRELEGRTTEARDAHDAMEQGLQRINEEAVHQFGDDLNALLKRPAKAELAEEWAGEKMKQIYIPPKLLRKHYAQQAARHRG